MFRLKYLFIYLSLFLITSCQQKEDYQSQAEEIFPPVQMKHVALYRIAALPVSPVYFEGQWTIVIFGDANCQGDCLKRLALINDVEQAKKLFVADGPAQNSRLTELAGLFPNVAITMGATAGSFDSFYAQFDVEIIEPAQKHRQLYLVNPSKELVYSLPQHNLSVESLQKEITVMTGN